MNPHQGKKPADGKPKTPGDPRARTGELVGFARDRLLEVEAAKERFLAAYRQAANSAGPEDHEAWREIRRLWRAHQDGKPLGSMKS